MRRTILSDVTRLLLVLILQLDFSVTSSFLGFSEIYSPKTGWEFTRSETANCSAAYHEKTCQIFDTHFVTADQISDLDYTLECWQRINDFKNDSSDSGRSTEKIMMAFEPVDMNNATEICERQSSVVLELNLNNEDLFDDFFKVKKSIWFEKDVPEYGTKFFVNVSDEWCRKSNKCLGNGKRFLEVENSGGSFNIRTFDRYSTVLDGVLCVIKPSSKPDRYCCLNDSFCLDSENRLLSCGIKNPTAVAGLPTFQCSNDSCILLDNDLGCCKNGYKLVNNSYCQEISPCSWNTCSESEKCKIKGAQKYCECKKAFVKNDNNGECDVRDEVAASVIKNPKNLTDDQIAALPFVLDNIPENENETVILDIVLAGKDAVLNNKLNVTETNILTFAKTLSELQTKFKSNDKKKAEEIVKSINLFASKLQLQEPVFVHETPTFTLLISLLNKTSTKSIFTHKINNATVLDVQLPEKEASENDPDARDQSRANLIFYDDPSLFPNNYSATSQVVSIELDSIDSDTKLSSPVVINFRKQTTLDLKSMASSERFVTNLHCVYWDFSTSDWKDDGCVTNVTNDGATCTCDHLTNFALIAVNADKNLALELVCGISSLISMACLLLTAFIHLMHKEIKKRNSTKILVHLCINLTIFYLIIFTGLGKATDNVSCSLVAILLQYFGLTSWCWMFAYSYDMYYSLVVVLHGYKSKFLHKLSIFAYGFPFLVVMITAGVTLGALDSLGYAVEDNVFDPYQTPRSHISTYRSARTCFLHSFSAYFGFFLPIGAMFTANIVIFFKVLSEVARKKSETVHNQELTTRQALTLTLTMNSITGGGWIFLFFLLINKSEVYVTIFSWLVAIFVSTQGLAIFLMTTVRRDDLRKIWLDPLMKKVRKTKPTQTIPQLKGYSFSSFSNEDQKLKEFTKDRNTRLSAVSTTRSSQSDEYDDVSLSTDL